MGRAFNDTSDNIRTSIGGLSSASLSATTLVVLMERIGNTPAGTFRTPIALHNSSGTAVNYIQFDDANKVQFGHDTAVVGSTTTVIQVSNNWVVLACTKAAGTVAPVFHSYVYDTNTWTHETAGSTLVDGSSPGAGGTVRFGDWQGGDRAHSRLKVAAVYTRVLSNLEIENLAHSLVHWHAAVPAGLWLFDQSNVAQPIVDLSGGGAHETSRSGTSIATSNLGGFSYGASPIVVTTATVETAKGGSDSATFTDSSNLIVADQEDVTDSAVWSEHAGVSTTHAPPPLPSVFLEIGFGIGADTGLALTLNDEARGIIGVNTISGTDVVWTDVSQHLISGSISRGSNRVDSPVIRYEAGTGTFLLDNSDRRFDPTNLNGPYVAGGVTQVKPRKAVRCRAGWLTDHAGESCAQTGAGFPSDTSYLVTTDADAAGLRADDWVEFQDSTGTRYDTMARRIIRLESAFGFTNVILSTALPQIPIEGDQLVVADLMYDLIRGSADGWDIEWSDPNWSTVTLTVTDASKILAGVSRGEGEGVGVGASEDSGARITRILDSAGWPESDRHIAVGDSTLQATNLAGEVLSELQLVADSELGELYVDGSGAVVFRNRNAQYLDSRSNTPQAVFGDATDGSELRYTDLEISYDDTTLSNQVRAQIEGSANPQVAEDEESIQEYGPSTLERTDLVLETDQAAADWASFVIQRTKSPELRFDGLTVFPLSEPNVLFPQSLGRLFGDRITVRRRPPGGGDLIERDVYIRGVSHEFDPGKWQTRWTLQHADTLEEGGTFVIGDEDLGALDDGNVLAF